MEGNLLSTNLLEITVPNYGSYSIILISTTYLYRYQISRRPSLLLCSPSALARTPLLVLAALCSLHPSVRFHHSRTYALTRPLALATVRSLSGSHARACARAQPLSRALCRPHGHCGARILVHSVPCSTPAASVLISSAWRRCHQCSFFAQAFLCSLATRPNMDFFPVATGFCSARGPARGASSFQARALAQLATDISRY